VKVEAMLASLLPGLRDVRTPLAVGYLWILNSWLVLADHFPRHRPDDSSVIAHLFDLHGTLGVGAGLAAISFTAFLIGSILTVDPGTIRRWLTWMTRGKQQAFAADLQTHRLASLTRSEDELISKIEAAAAEYGVPVPPMSWSTLVPKDDLRAQLLVANMEMYGEYDRLDSEAVFRVNIAPPLTALGVILAFDLGFDTWTDIAWAAGLTAMACLLAIQGFGKRRLSRDVLIRSVLSGPVEHPFIATLRTPASAETRES
jgi:hypothetical protein